ncbi:MAG TPA: SDR family NAD(P)-dependent oxidoreductase [Solirubrobacteraceae bacterium]|jgi:glucose 1-dehydrogenase|nr:SDR family NAD(P)-dependent oxidoreductase [Solirubrobacteraceae bacterium]
MGGTLRGKRALVTGASSGIGRATAALFVQQGAEVLGFDRRGTSVDGVERFEGDVTSSTDVSAAVEQAAGGQGLDILVANAGVADSDEWLTAKATGWTRMIDINLVGVMRCFQAAAANMIDHGRKGRLLATTSVAGVRAFDDTPAYGASKAGVISVVKSAAIAFAAHEITVNAVAPGHIDTELHRELDEQIAMAQQRTAEDVRAQTSAGVPLRRMGRPVEIAEAFVFLASDAAAYITGETICVDGGLLLV